MAKVSQGNALTTPLLQPGYTIDNDGYGVLTCKAVYKCDDSTAATAMSQAREKPMLRTIPQRPFQMTYMPTVITPRPWPACGRRR